MSLPMPHPMPHPMPPPTRRHPPTPSAHPGPMGRATPISPMRRTGHPPPPPPRAAAATASRAHHRLTPRPPRPTRPPRNPAPPAHPLPTRAAANPSTAKPSIRLPIPRKNNSKSCVKNNRMLKTSAKPATRLRRRCSSSPSPNLPKIRQAPPPTHRAVATAPAHPTLQRMGPHRAVAAEVRRAATLAPPRPGAPDTGATRSAAPDRIGPRAPSAAVASAMRATPRRMAVSPPPGWKRVRTPREPAR